MARMKYYLGPWVWDREFPCWRAPSGATSALDFRSIPDQSLAGQRGARPYGLFVTPDDVALSSDYDELGAGDDARDVMATERIRSAFASLIGFEPSGPTLLDLVWDVMTTGSDPTGQERCKPLMPTQRSTLDLSVGGERPRRVRFDPRHTHWPKVRDVLRTDLGRAVADAERDVARGASTRRLDVPRKVLGGLCRKYGIAIDDRGRWEQLLPATLRGGFEGPLAPETLIAENFNTADSSTLGPQLTWAEPGGDEWAIVSNAAQRSNTGSAADDRIARAEHDLSSDDHYSQADLTVLGAISNHGGVACRIPSGSGTTFYCYFHNNSTGDFLRLFKCVTGTFTQLGSDDAETLTAPETIQLRVDGSTIQGFWNAVERHNETDTAITGNVRCGLYSQLVASTPYAFDNFQAADNDHVAAPGERVWLFGPGHMMTGSY